MTQASLIVALLKVFCVTGILSLTGWVALYTHYARWWHDPIGRTLVVKTLLIATLLVPTTLSLFLHFNRLTSVIAGWVDTGLIGLITPVMVWRIAVWRKIHRTGGVPRERP